MTDIFSKQPYESFTISADFSANMVIGETISSHEVIAELDGVNIPDVIDSSSVSGQTVQTKVQSGELNKIYTITFRAITSVGNKWELDVFMKITP